MKIIKTKRLVGMLGCLLALILTLSLATPALAVPQIPHQFWGTVTIGTEPAPEGTTVKAKIGEVYYATTTVDVEGKYGYDPVFQVPADDPGEPGKDGGTNGETIEFYVDDVLATTFTFQIGGSDPLNLTVTIADTTHPTVTINQESEQADPTNTSPINFTVVFSESVSDFATGDVTLGGTAGATTATVTGSGTTYNVAVSGMTSDGTVIASIAAGVAHDAAANPNTASTSTDNSVTYDTTHPTVTLDSTASDPTSTSPIPVTATFSEGVTGFVVWDITVGNGAASNLAAGEGSTYTFNVTPTAEGEVTVDIASDVAEDAAGNGNTAATQFSITYTAAPPAVTIDAVTTPTNVTTQTLTGTRAADATVTLTSATATFGAVSYPTSTTWSCVATLAEGSNNITATADTTTAEATIVLDTTAPTVTDKTPAADATGIAVTTTVTATFSESMKASTITTISFTLSSDAGAITGTVAYNDTTKTATFSPAANLAIGTTYTATLSTAITDTVGNPLTSAYSWSFTTVAGSLGDGIDNTPAGGTLNLGGGTYTGDAIINKPITITGGTVLGGITINELTGSEVILENLTITDYTDYGIRIVNVRSVDTFIIRNNTLQGTAGSIVGILVDEVEAGGTLTIEKNYILGNETGIKLLADVTDATINYNDITGNSVAGLELVTGGNTNAEKNWWGDLSGPEQVTTNPRGEGNTVIGDATYQPWLTRQYATTIADNIAYYGGAYVNLTTGWNILSTPIALDPGADTWGEYVVLGSPDLHIHETNPAYSFDNQQGIFIAVTSSYQLKPCDAIYVRMTQADRAPILYSPNTSVPTKTLYTGWNLVGLANLGDMSVTDALTSVYRVAGDYTGYSLVISPAIGNQTPWVYIRDAGSVPEMQWTKGYWVFMVNAPEDTTLAGFTFTPQTLVP